MKFSHGRAAVKEELHFMMSWDLVSVPGRQNAVRTPKSEDLPYARVYIGYERWPSVRTS